MFNAGLLNSSGEPVVLGLALAYGGLAQFAGRHVGIPPRQHVRGGHLRVLRVVLVVLLAARAVLRRSHPRRRAQQRDRAVLHLVCDPHGAAVGRVHAHDCSGQPDALPADRDLPAAGHRRRRLAQRDRQDRWLVRHRDRGGGAVCRLRFGHQQHAGADKCCRSSPCAERIPDVPRTVPRTRDSGARHTDRQCAPASHDDAGAHGEAQPRAGPGRPARALRSLVSSRRRANAVLRVASTAPLTSTTSPSTTIDCRPVGSSHTPL